MDVPASDTAGPVGEIERRASPKTLLSIKVAVVVSLALLVLVGMIKSHHFHSTQSPLASNPTLSSSPTTLPVAQSEGLVHHGSKLAVVRRAVASRPYLTTGVSVLVLAAMITAVTCAILFSQASGEGEGGGELHPPDDHEAVHELGPGVVDEGGARVDWIVGIVGGLVVLAVVVGGGSRWYLRRDRGVYSHGGMDGEGVHVPQMMPKTPDVESSSSDSGSGDIRLSQSGQSSDSKGRTLSIIEATLSGLAPCTLGSGSAEDQGEFLDDYEELPPIKLKMPPIFEPFLKHQNYPKAVEEFEYQLGIAAYPNPKETAALLERWHNGADLGGWSVTVGDDFVVFSGGPGRVEYLINPGAGTIPAQFTMRLGDASATFTDNEEYDPKKAWGKKIFKFQKCWSEWSDQRTSPRGKKQLLTNLEPSRRNNQDLVKTIVDWKGERVFRGYYVAISNSSLIFTNEYDKIIIELNKWSPIKARAIPLKPQTMKHPPPQTMEQTDPFLDPHENDH